MDDVAEESVRAASRAHVESLMAKAVEVVKSNSKNRDPARLVEVRLGGLRRLIVLAKLAGNACRF